MCYRWCLFRLRKWVFGLSVWESLFNILQRLRCIFFYFSLFFPVLCASTLSLPIQFRNCWCLNYREVQTHLVILCKLWTLTLAPTVTWTWTALTPWNNSTTLERRSSIRFVDHCLLSFSGNNSLIYLDKMCFYFVAFPNCFNVERCRYYDVQGGVCF